MAWLEILHLPAFALLLTGAWSIGYAVGRLLRLPETACRPYALALGLAVLSHAVLLAAVGGALKLFVLAPLLGIATCMGVRPLARALRDNPVARCDMDRAGTDTKALWCCIAILCATGFARSLLPTRSLVTAQYHFALAKTYAREGKLAVRHDLSDHTYLKGIQMLQAAGFLLGGETCADWINFTLTLLAITWAGRIAREAGGARARNWTYALLLATSTLSDYMLDGEIEIALGLYVLLGFHLLFRSRDTGDLRTLALGAALMGFAVGIKQTAWFPATVWLFALGTDTRRGRIRWRDAGGLAAAFLSMALPQPACLLALQAHAAQGAHGFHEMIHRVHLFRNLDAASAWGLLRDASIRCPWYVPLLVACWPSPRRQDIAARLHAAWLASWTLLYCAMPIRAATLGRWGLLFIPLGAVAGGLWLADLIARRPRLRTAAWVSVGTLVAASLFFQVRRAGRLLPYLLAGDGPSRSLAQQLAFAPVLETLNALPPRTADGRRTKVFFVEERVSLLDHDCVNATDFYGGVPYASIGTQATFDAYLRDNGFTHVFFCRAYADRARRFYALLDEGCVVFHPSGYTLLTTAGAKNATSDTRSSLYALRHTPGPDDSISQ